MFVLL